MAATKGNTKLIDIHIDFTFTHNTQAGVASTKLYLLEKNTLPHGSDGNETLYATTRQDNDRIHGYQKHHEHHITTHDDDKI